MKVAFFVKEFPSYTQTFVLRQIAGVMENKIPVTIFSTRNSGLRGTHHLIEKHQMLTKTKYLPKVQESRSKRVVDTLRLCFKPGWIKRHRFLVKAFNPVKYGRAAVSLKLFLQCLPFLDNGHFDILHSQFGSLGAAVCNLRQIGVLSGKMVTSFRGIDTETFLKKHPDAYRRLFRQGDLFLPVCDYFKKWLIDNGCPEHKVEVIRSGIDMSEFSFHVRKPQPYGHIRLLSVARMVEKKGLRYAIEAVAKLRHNGNNISYTIIGEGPLHSELEQQAFELGIRDQICMPGMKSHDQVLSEIQNSHILLSPSITAADGDREGIPNILKEAMATGMPVVSTWHSGIPELVEDQKAGFLVPEKDVGALENRLQLLINHPELWPRMGQVGRSIVEENYDIHSLNKRMLQLYHKLANNHE